MELRPFPRTRPPCSRGEHAAAEIVRRDLAAAGLEVRVEALRAPTSPSWAPVATAMLRLGTLIALLVGAGRAAVWVAAAAMGTLLFPRTTAGLMAILPGFGGRSQNVVSHVRGAAGASDPPLVVVAHLDHHPTGGAPLAAVHRVAAALVTLAAAAVAAAVRLGGWAPPRALLVLLAVEPLVALVVIARGELVAPHRPEDDNGSGLNALLRLGELCAGGSPARSLWLVATGATTSGNWGMRAFLRLHRDVGRVAWVIELDALGAAELVAAPVRRRFPRRSTPAAVVRAVAGAAIDTGDVIDVDRRPGPHSDAVAAFRARVPALSLTAGRLVPGPRRKEPDPANAERAARIVARLAATTL